MSGLSRGVCRCCSCALFHCGSFMAPECFTCGRPAAQEGGKPPAEGAASTSRNTPAGPSSSSNSRPNPQQRGTKHQRTGASAAAGGKGAGREPPSAALEPVLQEPPRHQPGGIQVKLWSGPGTPDPRPLRIGLSAPVDLCEGDLVVPVYGCEGTTLT